MDANKFVRFDRFCGSCKHADLSEHEEPCDDCLTHPTNIDSHKPVKYEEKEKKK